MLTSRSRKEPLAISALALLLALSPGCSQRKETVSPTPGIDQDAQTAAAVKKDPIAFIESQIATLESDSFKYGEIEKNLQWELQKRRKDAADLAASVSAARTFGQKGKQVHQDPATVYPVVVEGRRFDSRSALAAEVLAASATLQREKGNLEIIRNQIATAQAKYEKTVKKRIAISGEIDTLRHKADSARLLVSQGKLDELDKMVDELVSTERAALPDDEYFSPSFQDVGAIGLDEEIGNLEF